jgi:hypothetical protein
MENFKISKNYLVEICQSCRMSSEVTVTDANQNKFEKWCYRSNFFAELRETKSQDEQEKESQGE